MKSEDALLPFDPSCPFAVIPLLISLPVLRLHVNDARYNDRQWLRSTRRWPPKLVEALEALLDVRSMAAPA